MNNKKIAPEILEQAADWLVIQHSGQMTAQQQQRFEAWLQQHPSHQRAIAHANHFHQHLQQIPNHLQRKQLLAAKQVFRQQLAKKLLLWLAPFALAYAGYALLPWQLWNADYATKVGEIKTITLPDGSRLTLASQSYINIDFKQQRKVELLAGEIYIETNAQHKKPQADFVVESHHGSVQALGTRFSLRQDSRSSATAVQVYQHAVAIRPAANAQRLILKQGFATQFNAKQIQKLQALNTEKPDWTEHLLVVDNQPLAQVLAEINRYTAGRILLQQQAKSIRVSGVFSLDNTRQSLETLAQTYQLQLNDYTPYLLYIHKK